MSDQRAPLSQDSTMSQLKPIEHRDLQQSHGARFGECDTVEVVLDYGDASAEYDALRQSVALLDFSQKGRICLTGSDRVRFLNGQITNNLKPLQPGQGCYAALLTAKGKMVSDMHVHCLTDELLLDIEPGLTMRVIERLQQFIVADDVEVVDLKPQYSHLSLQGPAAFEAIAQLKRRFPVPESPYQSVVVDDPDFGECVIVAVPRLEATGLDLFVPSDTTEAAIHQLCDAVQQVGGRMAGWTALEWLRIESGIPRFGQDMDDTTIPLEAGIEARAVRYNKGCYVGQEVVNRIHSIGQVAKSLRGLVLNEEAQFLPSRGDELLLNGKKVGHITSAIHSPRFKRPIALGYVRKEVNKSDTEVNVATKDGELRARVVDLPFDTKSM